MNLSEEQLCEAKMLDYSVAYARTVAGVHYDIDNIAGLTMGQEILAQKLPRYLQDEYGADYTAVKEAVEAARFDWTKFKKSDCWRMASIAVRTSSAKAKVPKSLKKISSKVKSPKSGKKKASKSKNSYSY
jgi:hypothetical protein